jgi:hypothetical protein
MRPQQETPVAWRKCINSARTSVLHTSPTVLQWSPTPFVSLLPFLLSPIPYHVSGRVAQAAEGDLWRSVAASTAVSDANDRAEEHWEAFSHFSALLPRGRSLGRVIEVGAGPWTQLRGILHVRPDLLIDHFTVWEPGAKRSVSCPLVSLWSDS